MDDVLHLCPCDAYHRVWYRVGAHSWQPMAKALQNSQWWYEQENFLLVLQRAVEAIGPGLPTPEELSAREEPCRAYMCWPGGHSSASGFSVLLALRSWGDDPAWDSRRHLCKDTVKFPPEVFPSPIIAKFLPLLSSLAILPFHCPFTVLLLEKLFCPSLNVVGNASLQEWVGWYKTPNTRKSFSLTTKHLHCPTTQLCCTNETLR